MDSTTSVLTRRGKSNYYVKQSSVSEEREFTFFMTERREPVRSGAEKVVMRKVTWMR